MKRSLIYCIFVFAMLCNAGCEAGLDTAQPEHFYFGAVIGMIFMSLLISTIHWLHSREHKVLLFSLLTVNTLFLVAAGLGLIFHYLTPTGPAMVYLLVPWSLTINTVLVGLVFGSALVVVCCTGWLSWVRWRSKARGAGFFLAAHGVLIGTLLTGQLILMGWLPLMALSELGWVLGLLIYLFLTHAGIFADSQWVKRERDAAFGEVKTAHDLLLTERKLRAEQTVFFSFVAHELRSPLAAIMIGIKNLEIELTDVRPTALARLKKIKAYAEKMASLIDRQLTLQSLTNADFSPRFSQVEPRQIAQECVQHVRALFAERVFVCDCAEGLPTALSVDQDLLQMALINLLINAAKFSPDSGVIALDVFAGTALHFRVSDRGPGVLPDQIERLFFIFNRVQQSDFKNGFGIGLAMARRVAEAHGGTLEYATREGGGAVFTLTLPLTRQGADA
jgi:signal transduction histidine kinase